MTNTQIAEMIRTDEKDRRRTRFELGISPAQYGKRINSKKAFRKGSRNSWKRNI